MRWSTGSGEPTPRKGAVDPWRTLRGTTFGEKIVAAEMVSIFNDRYSGQWLLLNRPFRRAAEFLYPDILAVVPERFQMFACALRAAPEHWGSPERIAEELVLAARRGAYVANALAMIRVQKALVDQYLRGELSREDEVPEPQWAVDGRPARAGEVQRPAFNQKQQLFEREALRRLEKVLHPQGRGRHQPARRASAFREPQQAPQGGHSRGLPGEPGELQREGPAANRPGAAAVGPDRLCWVARCLDPQPGQREPLREWDGRDCGVRSLRVMTDSGRRLAVYPYTDVDAPGGRAVSFPVRLGYAGTIYKYQGAELEHVTLWTGPTARPPLTSPYRACRATLTTSSAGRSRRRTSRPPSEGRAVPNSLIRTIFSSRERERVKKKNGALQRRLVSQAKANFASRRRLPFSLRGSAAGAPRRRPGLSLRGRCFASRSSASQILCPPGFQLKP